jgi:hypothetical protein
MILTTIVKNCVTPLGWHAMSDYTIPEPEPKEIDERLSVELSHLVDNQVLRGHPSGDERCDNCRYYLEPYKDLSYCWHPKLRILVGGNWWCQWWEEIPEGEATGT